MQKISIDDVDSIRLEGGLQTVKILRGTKQEYFDKSYYTVGDKISYGGVEYTVTHIEEIKDYIRVVAHC